MKKGIPLTDLFKRLNVGHPRFISEVNKWLEENRMNKHHNFADFNVLSDPDIKGLAVIVSGNAVFEDLDGIDNYTLDPGLKDSLKFLNIKGTYTTILSRLTPEEILQRIKKNYTKIYNDCYGKTTDQQNVLLFGVTNVINPGVIEEGEEYLKKLPANLSEDQFLDLADQILTGCLSYPARSNKYFTDQYSVQMDDYANSLKNRF